MKISCWKVTANICFRAASKETVKKVPDFSLKAIIVRGIKNLKIAEVYVTSGEEYNFLVLF